MGYRGMRSMINAPDEKPAITWPLLRRVLDYARPYRWLMVAMLTLILAHTGLALLRPLIMRDLIDRTIPGGQLRRLIWLALALLAIPAVEGAVSVVQRRVSARVGEGVIYDLRLALYANLQRMSLRFFTHSRVGELMSRLNNDVRGAQNAITSTAVGIITNLVRAVAVLSVMLGLEWRLTLISVAILPLFILAARLLGTRLRDQARAQLEATAQMNAMMNETLNIGGALLVKLFGRREVEIERFGRSAARVRDLGVLRSYTGSIFGAIIGLISAVGGALVYGLGGYLAIEGAFTVGAIVALSAYLGSLYGALQSLSNAPVEFATSMVSFERVFEVIDLPVDIPEAPDAVVLDEVQGEIVFEGVSFAYEPGNSEGQTVALLSEVRRYGRMEPVAAALSGAPVEAVGADVAELATLVGDKAQTDLGLPPEAIEEAQSEAEGLAAAEEGPSQRPRSQARALALDGVSFEAEPGQLVALVGPSGAGKTTLTYLIPRLYDPTAGVIRIDGHDLRQLALSSLAEAIGMVTQETYLFHDTIRTNLQYARLDATRPELEAACRVANIHDFIAALPEGYDTIVGERGYRLSGGEKQRLALARVILKDPRILVLDEATSSLDSESEALIQEALGKVMAGRTSVVIAHRLSTILAADLILVMDRGQIVERGTHASLLAQGGLYASLYQTQFRGES